VREKKTYVFSRTLPAVIPKMIGEGIPLVDPRRRDLPLKLLAARSFPDGVVRLHYAVGN
jgi:hypothetical protein